MKKSFCIGTMIWTIVVLLSIDSSISIAIAQKSGSSGLLEYTSPGTFTFSVPIGVTHVLFEGWGAGGGGGGGGDASGTAAGSGGGGGGGGAYTRGVLTVTGQNLQVVIGTGGIGGLDGVNGGNGGDSSLMNSSGVKLIFAGGGTGGISGKSNVTTCTQDGSGGAFGSGGQAEITAGISRAGANGSSGGSVINASCPTTPGCFPAGGGFGAGGGATTIGTMTPPGSIGGRGGNGRSPLPFSMSQQCPTGPPIAATPGAKGGDGYVILSW